MESPDHTGKPIAPLNRRDFFKRAALLGAAAGASSLTLSACMTAHGAGKAEESSESATKEAAPQTQVGKAGAETSPAKEAAELDCTDTTRLTPGEVKIREQLKYVDKTPKPEQDCANCLHWKPASDEGCGGCAVMAGPVHPKGWCIVWVPTRS